MTKRDSLELLRAECSRSSQAEVARRIGYSSPAVNQVLKGTYPGDPSAVLAKVEEVFRREATINCPVVGPITPAKCAEHRGRPFAATNPIRVTLFRTCPTCGGNPK